MSVVPKKWIVAPEISETALAQYPELPKVIAQLLLDRGVTNRVAIDNFLNVDFYDLHDPFLIQDMRKSVERIFQAVQKKQKIIVFGDYDSDGVSGSMILYQSISKIYQVMHSIAIAGLSEDETPRDHLDIYIPDRAKEGYGLNDESIQFLLQENPDLVITVDCGVTSFAQIKVLQDQGIDVIVVDHHSVPDTMPPAYGIIVPKRTGDPYPFKDLCGAGLAYKTATALMKELRFKGYSHLIPEGYEKWFLDFAAVGTIGDMVPLVGENRILVKYGLYVLAKSKNPGMQALLQSLNITPQVSEMDSGDTSLPEVSVYSVGFQISPRINAAGRIAHANHAIELFRARDSRKIQQLVEELNQLNEERKALTERVFQEVDDRINSYGEGFSQMKVIFEGDSDWPAGVIGIVASRMVEKYHKPTVLYQKRGHKNSASLRSVRGFDLAQIIASVKHLLIAGGGHSQAAGMSFKDESVSDLKRAFRQKADDLLTPDMLVPSLMIDARMDASEVNWTTYDLLTKLSPYGIGNPTPVFLLEKMTLNALRLVGKEKTHIQIEVQSERHIGVPVTLKGIGFGLGHLSESLYQNDTIDIVCKLTINEWKDQRTLQLQVLDMRRSDTTHLAQ